MAMGSVSHGLRYSETKKAMGIVWLTHGSLTMQRDSGAWMSPAKKEEKEIAEVHHMSYPGLLLSL
jgi:hypothetical protein